MPGNDYEICKASGKRCYTKRDAQGVLNSARKKHWERSSKLIPVRLYPCKDCGMYHLTKEACIRDKNRRKKECQTRIANERERDRRLAESLCRYRREYC